MFGRPPPAQEVLGHTIPEPRMTARAWWLILVWVMVPIALLGSLADAMVQWAFGVCTGLWCW